MRLNSLHVNIITVYFVKQVNTTIKPFFGKIQLCCVFFAENIAMSNVSKENIRVLIFAPVLNFYKLRGTLVDNCMDIRFLPL